MRGGSLELHPPGPSWYRDRDGPVTDVCGCFLDAPGGGKILRWENESVTSYMGSPSDIRAVLEGFVDDLHAAVDAHTLEAVLRDQETLTGATVGSKPEPWVRKHLIRPLLDAAGLEWEPEVHGGGEGYPDFGVTNLDVPVIGEDKPLNAVDAAKSDVQAYLNNRAASRGAEYGIATDGIEWVVYRIELGGDYLDYTPVEPTPIDFRDELLQIAADRNYVTAADAADGDDGASVDAFIETFEREAFSALLTREAPKRIRRQKQAGIEEFYDLFVELLFGEGSGSYDYETTLLDDITAPGSVPESERRRFAIRLVNRLLFVKFLEDRGVLPDGFLSTRVSNYRDAQAEVAELGGSLYKTQLEPLFFSLFNADDRSASHRGGWFDDVPYLNGSLFAPGEQERNYDVDDRMLTTVVRDLVEGHRLTGENGDGGLDPSVLGNVFEMTINHISSGEAQKEEGAYYTPSDVIRLITRKSVDPKIYEILVDVYASRIADGSSLDEADARGIVEEYDLGEMLREIEQRHGYFGDADAIQEAYDRLGELKVIDPSCGSGHFLTGVLDELHRVRMSLLRGLEGDDLRDEDVYRSKKELVLGSIYGVDVNPIAIEIARLRVWLKMVEDGWEESYGDLPNIDVNVVSGNSLVGLPAKSRGQSVLGAFDVDLSRIREVRDEYRNGEITRRELHDRIDELRPELRDQYLERLNHYFEQRIESADAWESITGPLDERYPTVRKLTVRRADGAELSRDQRARLEAAGFRVEPRYGKSAKVEDGDVDEVTGIPSLLDDGLVLDVERKPVAHDVRELEALKRRDGRLALSYEPFHWPLEFPEAVRSNGNGHEVEFDVVVGNPPYGDVLTDVERRFTDGYSAGSVNDVIAPFVERQSQILGEGGYIGNVLALLIAYQTNADPIRDVIRNSFVDAEIACFTRRPSQVFAGSQARTGILTGRKSDDADEEDVRTSRFIRFTDEDRGEAFRNVEYESTAGFTLGEKIGSNGDKSLPKIGEPEIKSILGKLKARSSIVFRDKLSRDESDRTPHVVWRSYHPSYFVNPFLEDLYPPGEQSRDFKPMYFDSERDRKAAFLIMQSSLYYLYWMVYENERDLNWKTVEAFPFPPEEELAANEQEISSLADELWTEMESRFLGNVRETFDSIGVVKPITDKADELFGPMYGLTDEEVEFVKSYDEEYRLSDVEPSRLVDVE